MEREVEQIAAQANAKRAEKKALEDALEIEQKSIPEWITPLVGVPAPTVTIPGFSPHGWVAPAGAGLPAPCDAQLDVVAVAPQMLRPALGSSPCPAQSIALLSSSPNTV